MTFPLRDRQLIRGCLAHKKAGLGCAADYAANYVTLRIPVSGIVSTFNGSQGGLWLRLAGDDGLTYEFAHLSKYLITQGRVDEATDVAITGNTGTITTGPHLHVQIKNSLGRRLDPEIVFANAAMPQEDDMTEEQKVALLFPQMVTIWAQTHPRKDLGDAGHRSIEAECRRIIRGEQSQIDLLMKWERGE